MMLSLFSRWLYSPLHAAHSGFIFTLIFVMVFSHELILIRLDSCLSPSRILTASFAWMEETIPAVVFKMPDVLHVSLLFGLPRMQERQGLPFTARIVPNSLSAAEWTQGILFFEQKSLIRNLVSKLSVQSRTRSDFIRAALTQLKSSAWAIILIPEFIFFKCAQAAAAL